MVASCTMKKDDMAQENEARGVLIIQSYRHAGNNSCREWRSMASNIHSIFLHESRSKGRAFLTSPDWRETVGSCLQARPHFLYHQVAIVVQSSEFVL